MIGRLRSDGGRALSWTAVYTVVSRVSSIIAVPLILQSLGDHVYAAWVLAGTLVMSQGLIDLGMGAATVRFVAVAAATGDRRAVRSVSLRSLIFYVGLSVVVGVALVVFAKPLISAMPALRGASQAGAVALITYTAIAFGISNVVLVFAAVLQGMGRIDAAYRGQAIGWLAYCPILAIGLSEGAGIDALGLAWVITYTVQALLLAPPIWSASRRLNGPSGKIPRTRELLSLGGRWSVSLWADFAALQLPRIVGGFSLDADALVQLDLAMRGAQLVVAPFFIAFPLVLPAAAREWAGRRRDGLRSLLTRWTRPLIAATVLLTAAAVPILRPLLALWSGRAVSSMLVAPPILVLVGVTMHTVTGLATSVLMAGAEVRLIVQYKFMQLLACVVLMTAAAPFGLTPLAAMLAASMTIPAIVFLVRAHRSLNAPALSADSAKHLAITAIALAGPALLLAAVLPVTLPAWEQVAAIAVALAAAATALALTPTARGFTTEAWRDLRTVERST